MGCSVREVIGLMANLRRERLVLRDVGNLIVDGKRLQREYDADVDEHYARF